ncbi:SDR family oxidoreductase, partial [bacterium]
GGAQGLGLAVAQRFVREGASVVIVDRNVAQAEAMAEEMGASSFGADLGDAESRSAVVPNVLERFGTLDILVNCHGVIATRPLMEVDPAQWGRTFAINTEATFFLIQDAARAMIPRGGGSIVNLASNSAFLPKTEQADYAASKAAIVSLTRSTAMALGPHGIRVNAIAPGVIPTPMTEGIAQARAEIRGTTKEEMLGMFEPLTALKRLGTPEEVASAVLFMASDDSAYVTGQTLEVCGGLLMR